MLRGIRKASANWLGRIVMGVVMTVLAGSFAIWGINDIFRGFGRSYLAKIGDTEIPIEQFRQTYNDRLQQLGQQLGHPDPARTGKCARPRPPGAWPDDRRGRARPARAARCGSAFPTPRSPAHHHRSALPNSDRPIRPRAVRRLPAQRRLLRAALFRRAAPADSAPGDHRRDLRRYPGAEGMARRRQSVPEPAAQHRTMSTLGPAQAGDIPQPTDEELSKYFDDRKILFRAPEYRKIATVAVTPAELAKSIEVSDEDVKKAYDEQPEELHHAGAPPRRADRVSHHGGGAGRQRAHQGGHELCGACRRARAEGARHRSRHGGEIGASSIRRWPMPPSRSRKAKSARRSRASSARSSSPCSRSSPRRPRRSPTWRRFIRNDIALERAKTKVQDIHDKIEDARAGGSTLEEAAQKLKLPSSLSTSTAPAAIPPASSSPTFPHAGEVISAAFCDRRRRRQRSDRRRRRLCLVRRRRHHAGARPHPRRGQERGRAALARRRDRQAAEGQGRRHARQAQERHHARQRSPRPTA